MKFFDVATFYIKPFLKLKEEPKLFAVLSVSVSSPPYKLYIVAPFNYYLSNTIAFPNFIIVVRQIEKYYTDDVPVVSVDRTRKNKNATIIRKPR